MAENGKKWLVGTLSATAVAVGSFTYDLVKPALQEQIKRYAPDFLQSTKEMVAGKKRHGSQRCKRRILPAFSLRAADGNR